MSHRRVTHRHCDTRSLRRTARVETRTALGFVQCTFLLLLLSPASLHAAAELSEAGRGGTESGNLSGGQSSQVNTPQAGVAELKRGEGHRREITRGQAHHFSIALEAGQYARIVIEQLGIDLVVSTFNPDGSPQIEFDSPTASAGREIASIRAGAAGEYRLEVRPAERWAAPGAYEISVEAIRLPTPADEKRLEAERAYADGRRLSAAAGSRGLAAESYERAVSLWQEAERLSDDGSVDRRGQANTLHSLGKLYRSSGNLQKTVESYGRALQLRREIADRQGEASTLSDIAAAYRDLDVPEKALEPYRSALQIFEELGNRRGEAGARHNIGFVNFLMRRNDEALKFYAQALSIRQSENDLRGEASTLNGMAGVHKMSGDTQGAMGLLEQAALKFREVGDRANEAVAKNNIGLIYDDWGAWQNALDTYREALAIHQSLPERERSGRSEAVAMRNISLMYAVLGETQRALDELEKPLSISLKLNEPSLIGSMRSTVGYVHFLRDDPEKALKFYEEALPFYEKAQDTLGQSQTLTIMGMAYTALGRRQQASGDTQGPAGNYKKALGYYERALRLQEKAENRQGQAITLDQMGDVHALLGDPRKGNDSYREALRLWQIVRDRNGEAITLYNLARLERDRGNLLEARKWIAAALDIVQSLRKNVISQQLRISYFASKQNYYELDIDVNMRLHKLYPTGGYDAAALQSSESARSRALIDLLAEAKVDIREGVEPGLLKREEVLGRKLNDKAALQTQLLSGPHAKADADALTKEITQLTNEYADVQAQIKARSPVYATLTHPRPLTLKEIQQQQLDDDTLLLEFALGSERSYVWVVSNRAIHGHELPARAVIEGEASRLYESLTAPQALPDDTPQKRRARVARAAARYPSRAKSLSRTLLGKVADKLGNKRLLIVADGALQYIPFAALPSPTLSKSVGRNTRAGKPGGTPGGVPLIVEHEIVALPSASTLAALRSGLGERKGAAGAVAVLADPVFDVNDARILAAKKTPPRTGEGGSDGRSSATTTVGTLNRADFFLRRLHLTAQEAEAIKDAASPQDVMVAVGFEASRHTLMRPELRQYRIIHFATHGVLNNVHPELSGIVLSQVDEQGAAQDGMLRLHDIYNLRLPAELVVLSACDTGLGKDIRGEGLVSLTRGFMYAGSPRVVATMWKVDDYATSLFMKSFYEHMFKKKLSPAAALRQAQIGMMRQGRWRDPFNWAAFVLHGEARNMR
jgi:CHAT domain-containing protein/tetratricopeptide (TPR) repeat protein